jgi:hypothetical protein
MSFCLATAVTPCSWGPARTYTQARNALISCAETWPAKTVRGSVGLSLQTAFPASDPSLQP